MEVEIQMAIQRVFLLTCRANCINLLPRFQMRIYGHIFFRCQTIKCLLPVSLREIVLSERSQTRQPAEYEIVFTCRVQMGRPREMESWLVVAWG